LDPSNDRTTSSGVDRSWQNSQPIPRHPNVTKGPSRAEALKLKCPESSDMPTLRRLRRLTRVAGYNLANPETIEFFIEVSAKCGRRCPEPPVPATYRPQGKGDPKHYSRQVVENIFALEGNPNPLQGDQQLGPRTEPELPNRNNIEGAKMRTAARTQIPNHDITPTTAPPSYANVPVGPRTSSFSGLVKGDAHESQGCPRTKLSNSRTATTTRSCLPMRTKPPFCLMTSAVAEFHSPSRVPTGPTIISPISPYRRRHSLTPSETS